MNCVIGVVDDHNNRPLKMKLGWVYEVKLSFPVRNLGFFDGVDNGRHGCFAGLYAGFSLVMPLAGHQMAYRPEKQKLGYCNYHIK